MEQYKESYELLSAALSFHVAYELARVDGKIDLSDIQFLMTPMVKLPAAIGDAGLALDEMKNMDPAARGEMLQKLALEYDIPNDLIEAKVEAGLEWLVATGKFLGVLLVKPAPAPDAA